MKHHRKPVYLCCRSVCSVGTNSCVRLWIVIPRIRTPRERERDWDRDSDSQVKPLFGTVISAPPFSCKSSRLLHARGKNRRWLMSSILRGKKAISRSWYPPLPPSPAPSPPSHVTEGAQHPQERLGQTEKQFGFSPSREQNAKSCPWSKRIIFILLSNVMVYLVWTHFIPNVFPCTLNLLHEKQVKNSTFSREGQV